MIRQVTEAATGRGGREERKVKGRLLLEEVVGRLGTGGGVGKRQKVPEGQKSKPG